MIDFAFLYTTNKNNQFLKSSVDFFKTLYPVDQIETFNIEDYYITIVKNSHSAGCNGVLQHYGKEESLLLLLGDLKINDSHSFVNTNKQINNELLSVLETEEFKKLDGNFLILYLNRVNSDVKLINSKLGLIPCYYYAKDNQYIVSTRMGLFQSVLSGLKINWGAVAQYALYNYIASDCTFFKDVYSLPPATALKFNGNSSSYSVYWNIEDEMVDKPLSFRKSIALIDDSLNEISRDIIGKNDLISISLTGGWDGRILLAYASRFAEKDQILLYSFGSKNSPDVFIPEENAERLNYEYIPIDLENNGYTESIAHWAKETTYRSDGLRSPMRSHYLYTMDILRDKTDFIISGIGGSNLIKSGKYQSSNVYNQNVLELMFSDNYEGVLKKHFDYTRRQYPEFFPDLSEQEFIDSFQTQRFLSLFNNYSPKRRMFHFLIGEVERKYFGYELMSYRHLIRNYAPFFDMRFIRALAKSSLFGGYDSGNSYLSPFQSALLYARLVYRNAPELARQKTDRGFSLYDLLYPLNPGIINKYLNMKRKVKDSNGDHFKNRQVLEKVTSRYLKDYSWIAENYTQSEFVANYLSTILYLRKVGEKV